MALFIDRKDAGRQLAQELTKYGNRADVIVLALPRGGVPVGAEVAKALHAPLDVFIVRKLGVPGQEELAMGAIASGGVRILNEEIVHTLHIPPEVIERIAAREWQELQRREALYRGNRPAPQLSDRVVILVDDGVATGATMRAAIKAVRQHRPKRIVVAVPVSALETYHDLVQEADEVVALATPEPFFGVGLWYDIFGQTSDDEVRAILRDTARAYIREQQGEDEGSSD